MNSISEDLISGRDILLDDLYSAKRADEREIHGILFVPFSRNIVFHYFLKSFL